MRRKSVPETSTAPETPTIAIREQISQMAPVTREELNEAPENTDTEAQPLRGPSGRLLKKDGTERAPRGSRKTGVQQPVVDPLMNDPRYREAIEGLNFYGAPRILKRGFKAAGTVMKDSAIPLSPDEERHVDNYFYALSKHTQFDPMATLIGRLILFVLLMGELIAWRWLKYSPLGARLQKLLSDKDEDQSEQIKEPVQ